MSTASPVQPVLDASDLSLSASLWMRIGAAIRAAWRPARHVARTAAKSADEMTLPTVAAKVATISVAGEQGRSARHAMSRAKTIEKSAYMPPVARRPGVQGRWKTSDRVAMF